MNFSIFKSVAWTFQQQIHQHFGTDWTLWSHPLPANENMVPCLCLELHDLAIGRFSKGDLQLQKHNWDILVILGPFSHGVRKVILSYSQAASGLLLPLQLLIVNGEITSLEVSHSGYCCLGKNKKHHQYSSIMSKQLRFMGVTHRYSAHLLLKWYHGTHLPRLNCASKGPCKAPVKDWQDCRVTAQQNTGWFQHF